jgi:hypothetical protein
MGKKRNNKSDNTGPERYSEEWDFSEGFGGIPENVSLTKNIGCASDSADKVKKTLKNYPKKD